MARRTGTRDGQGRRGCSCAMVEEGGVNGNLGGVKGELAIFGLADTHSVVAGQICFTFNRLVKCDLIVFTPFPGRYESPSLFIQEKTAIHITNLK